MIGALRGGATTSATAEQAALVQFCALWEGGGSGDPEQVSGDGAGSLAGSLGGIRGWGKPRPEPPQAEEMKYVLANLKVLLACVQETSFEGVSCSEEHDLGGEVFGRKFKTHF